jgi:ribosomal RNA-processing protein 7
MSGAFAGFTPLALSYGNDATHYLYIRAHAGKGELPAGRTLFAANVPPDATPRELALLFKPAGTVERVAFPDADDDADADPLAGMSSDVGSDEDEEMEEEEAPMEARPRKRRRKADAPRTRAPAAVPLPPDELRVYRRSGRTAHVVFLDASSLQRALLLAPARWPPGDPSPSAAPRGLAHYIAAHAAARPPLALARRHADAYMARFDHARAQERRVGKYRKGEAVVDADGFTLVTRGGAYGQTAGGGVGVASRAFQDTVAKRGVGAVQGAGAEGRRGKGRRKREGKEKDKFYKFQIHEERRNGACVVIGVRCHSHPRTHRPHRAQTEVGGGQGKGRRAQGVARVQAVLAIAPVPCILHCAHAQSNPHAPLSRSCRWAYVHSTRSSCPRYEMQSSSPGSTARPSTKCHARPMRAFVTDGTHE